MSILMRPQPQTAQAPVAEKTEPLASAPTPSVPTPVAPSTPPEVKPSIKPMESTRTPITNDVNQRPADGHTCWFQTVRGGAMTGTRCQIKSRINVNNDRVFDVIEPSGLKRSIVLWDNDEVEVFLKGTRYVGTWSKDREGDVIIDLPGGSFAFKPSN